jgi:hypothetical protein
MLEMFNAAFPVFERVTVCGALVVPVVCWLNVRLLVEKLTAGAGGGGELPPPPPPPQATQTPMTSNALASGKATVRLRMAARLVSIARHSIMANFQCLPEGA